MDPNNQLPPALQEALMRRQGAQGGQPAQSPQMPPGAPQAPQGAPVPPPAPMPAQGAPVAPPTPEAPYDIQEIKLIEGALIGRLKLLSDLQNPNKGLPTQGGQ